MVYCIYQATGGVSAKPSGMCDNPSGCCSIINTFLPGICCNTLGRSGVTTTYLASSDQLLKIQTLTISIQSPSSCEVYAHTHTRTIHVFTGGVQGSGERRRSYQCGECGPGGGGEGGERGGVEPAPGERVPQQRGILHFLLLNQRTPHQIVIHL